VIAASLENERLDEAVNEVAVPPTGPENIRIDV
jgi:hypothetical protein